MWWDIYVVIGAALCVLTLRDDVIRPISTPVLYLSVLFMMAVWPVAVLGSLVGRLKRNGDAE